MNVNFISRCSVINHCRKSVLLKTYFDSYIECTVKRVSNCTCPLVFSSSDLTSKNDPGRGRNYCTNNPSTRKLPPLMSFPEIVWPSVIKSFRNFILSTFIIKPYFDREFNLQDFVTGSKQAVEVVSSKISDGDLNTLDGLVTEEIMPQLQRSISQMSLSQRQQLAINKDDIYFSFPYQIGVMFDEEESKSQKRFVEITMVYHTLRGLESMKNRGEDLPLNVGMLPQYRDNISICNYRFIREFTKGVEGEWTINLLNHFKPTDYIEQ